VSVRHILVTLALIVACGHDEHSGPATSPPPSPPGAGSAAEHLQQALAAEGIHQRGDTPVDAGSLESFARSFVAILSSGDQRSALSLLHGKVWEYDCSSNAGRAAAEKLGGLLVSTPRNISFSSVEPRTISKGERLGGCAVTAATTVQVVHVKWTAPAGDATLEVAHAGDHAWTLTAIHDQ
jgi:hypothetical protein